jgi:hypothetical protein
MPASANALLPFAATMPAVLVPCHDESAYVAALEAAARDVARRDPVARIGRVGIAPSPSLATAGR